MLCLSIIACLISGLLMANSSGMWLPAVHGAASPPRKFLRESDARNWLNEAPEGIANHDLEEAQIESAEPPIRQASVNIVDLFWQYLNEDDNGSGRSASIKAMTDAKELGFTFYRFACSAFWPVQLQLWFNKTSRPLYWAAFDQLMEDATKLGVKLVPSILWNHFAIPDLCREPMHAMFEESTCSHSAIKTFTQELVSRYQDSTLVLWWELGNELNLLADLDMENRTAGCAPAMGTPKMRSKADNFSTNEMIALQKEWADWIWAIDKHHRPISSGFSIPRDCAEHLRSSYRASHRDWTADSKEEFGKNLIEIHSGLDIISVHLYNGDPTHDNLRFNISKDPDSAALLGIVQGLASNASKLLHIGEYGNPKPGQRQYSRNVLQVVVEKKIAMSTIWVWEFYSSPTQLRDYSLLPSQDPHFIKCMQEANEHIHNGERSWMCTEPPDNAHGVLENNSQSKTCPDFHILC